MTIIYPLFLDLSAASAPPGNDLGINLTDGVFCFSTYQASSATGSVNPLRLAGGADIAFVNGVADESTTQNAFVDTWRNQVIGQPDIDNTGSASSDASQAYRRGLSPFPSGVNGIFSDFRAGFVTTSSMGFNATGWTFMSVVVTNSGNTNNTLAVLGDDNNTSNAVQLRLNNTRLGYSTSSGDYNFSATFNSLSVLTIVCPSGATNATDLTVLQNNTALTGSGSNGNPAINQNTGMVLHNRNFQNVNGSLSNGGTVFNAFWNNASSSQYLANISALRTFFGI